MSSSSVPGPPLLPTAGLELQQIIATIANCEGGIAVLPSAHAGSDLLRAFVRLWLSVCVCLIVLLVGSRALPYVLGTSGLAELHARQVHFIAMASHILRPLAGPVLLLAGALLWFGRRRWRDPDTGRWATPGWLAVVIYTGLLVGHGAFDFDPTVAGPAWLSLPFLIGSGWRARLAASGRRVAVAGTLGLCTVLFAPALFFSETPGDAVGIGLWAVAWLQLALRSDRLALHDRGWLAAAALVAAQLAASFSPAVLPTHGGQALGDEMAYTWCEHPSEPRLFAAVTGCPTTPGLFTPHEACQSGHIAEIDPRTMRVKARHTPLTPAFFGRIEQVVCLPDGRLRLGMADNVIDAIPRRDNAAEIDPDDSTHLVRRLFGEDIGHRMVYDARHHATLYVSEHTGLVFRVDERTGAVDRAIGSELGLGDAGGSRVTSDGALHDGRDTVYLTDWMAGGAVYELSRATGALQRAFVPRGGGAFEVTVDEAMDRLYLSHSWGIDVVDLETGEVALSRRQGFMARRPAVDAIHGLVYVPSTTDGKVRVYDHETLEPVGSLRVGYGSRDAYITEDGKRLLTSSSWGMYYWNTRDLARRFGREP